MRVPRSIRRIAPGRFLKANLRAVARSPLAGLAAGVFPAARIPLMAARTLTAGDPGLWDDLTGFISNVGTQFQQEGGVTGFLEGALGKAKDVLTKGPGMALAGGVAAGGGTAALMNMLQGRHGKAAQQHAAAALGGRTHRHRRINPMNAKAARRAASRVKSSIHMLERLKKSLPHVSHHGHITKGRGRKR